MRHIGAPLAFLLIASVSRALVAQVVPVDPDSSSFPAGAHAVDYAVVSVYETNDRAPVSRTAQEGAGSGQGGPALRLREGMLIETGSQYVRVFGSQPEGIDWKTQRVYVVEELTVYRFDSIDSRTTLSGVYRTSDALYIELTSTHLGPCQGIAQQPEWFSFHRRFVAIRIPRLPEKIVTRQTIVGGCPPDIP